jgi:type I restriction enzyme S subunit
VSRIGELIAKHCPSGVPYSSVTAVSDYIRGVTYNKNNEQSDGPVQVLRANNITLASNSLNFKDVRRVASSVRVRENQRLVSGDILICAGSGSKAHIGKVAFINEDMPQTFGGFMAVLRTNEAVESRFLFHLLVGDTFSGYLKSALSTTTINNLNTGVMRGFRIPVPPLEVQREIVRILDPFTQLEAELEAELEARRRQYEHYAGALLSSDHRVPRARFGDVARIVRGASPRPIQNFITDSPDGVPWIKIGDVPACGKYITRTGQRVTLEGAAKSRRVQPGDFVLSNSMSFGRPYISKIDGYIHDGWLAISGFEESFISDYLYYLLRSSPMQEEFARRAGAGTVKNLNAEIVRSVEVPVPTKDAQARVVELLDKFDALVNDLSVGLPAELAARRKQYEYYRDRLLTFEELEA